MMYKQTLLAFLIVLACGFWGSIFGQKPVTIKLDNPSFEDRPSVARTPKGWYNCGFETETPPDIQPNGLFGFLKEAYRGSTYLGMVVRDNNTWEAVGQELTKPILKDIKYSFSLYVYQAEKYISKSRETGENSNYTVPAVIKIWASDSSECGRVELLAQSQPINFRKWTKLEFTFTPKADYKYFIIEAFYVKVFKFAYNGNILIDNASAIVPTSAKN